MNCRVLLDNASTSNFITVSCAKKLKLKKRKAYVPINGQTELGCTKGSVDVTFGPYFDETKLFNMEAYIVPKISKLPMKEIGNSVVSHLPKINLADPEFQTSAEIDILVGAELYYEIVDGEKNMDSSTSPIAIKSQLGWLIGGSKTTSKRELTMCHTQTNELEKLNHSENMLKLETLMKSFWELETLPALPILSNEEKLCEVLFNKTVKRDCDGSFIVQYPFKEPRIELGSSLSIAIRQFKQVEKRLHQKEHYLTEYKKFMNEYESLGHMVEVSPPTATSKFRCYLPHHFVLKESSTTTKFRVVFNASAKTSNGVTLNETMMIGPSTQDSLANLIMRFRKHKIAVTADIEKMYRQVKISSEDQELQHIVWRELLINH